MSSLIHQTDEKTTHAHTMRDVIRLRSNTVRNMIQSQDIEERYELFDELIEHTEAYEATRDKLVSLGSNEREQFVLDQIDHAYKTVSEAFENANEHIHATGQDEYELEIFLNELEFQELVLITTVDGLVTLEKILADEALEKNQQAYKETRSLLGFIMFGAFALSIVISGIIIARVTKANRKISHLANHDDLTGLHNRRSFEQHLQYTIDIAERSNNAYGILYIDLDKFKMVNDTCGHNAGDELLIQITALINERLRKGDVFARLGGDEFSIIAQGKSFEDICLLANDLRQKIADFIFSYEGQNFDISLSIGVTPIDAKAESVERILADVDSACYVAKKSGRNKVHITEDSDANVVQYRSNMAGIQAVKQALSDKRLALYFQPVYEVNGDLNQMAKCEILLRIQNENGELYSPNQAIPVAEKYNIMTEIDQWVFDNVVEWLVGAQHTHVVPRLLINLSGHSFADNKFTNFIIDKLQSTGIDTGLIAFEISEAAIISNFEHVCNFSNSIRALGCELVLDDFGSGYSNFGYLKTLAFDYLKIDGSLVHNIAKSEVDRSIVSAINQMGHTVGAKTIAEFVEDDASLKCLQELGVDYAQGFGLSVPTPLENLTGQLPPRLNSDKPKLIQDSSVLIIPGTNHNNNGKPYKKAS